MNVQEIMGRAETIWPMLAGLGPDVQGAVLADLVATWIVGHQGEGVARLREELLGLHIALVRGLVPINEAIMRDRIKQVME